VKRFKLIYGAVMHDTQNWKGSLAMVAGMGFYMAGDVFIKFVIGKLPVFEIQAVRGVASIVACLALIVAMGHTRQLVQLRNPWLLIRGLFEIVASFSFYLAISYLPLADVTAIVQTFPLLMIVGAWLVWREPLGWARTFLVVLGVAGALLVAQPGATATSKYALLGFVIALALVGRDLVIRKAPQDVSPLVAVVPLLIIVTFASTIATLFFETPLQPDAGSLFYLSISAVFLVIGHATVYLAYKLAPASAVAPFMYSLTVWAVTFGIVFFGDIPNPMAFAGMAIIVAAGLMIIWLDAQRQRQGNRIAQSA
jgi:drug/metabolite transporter (DMT)-like permease